MSTSMNIRKVILNSQGFKGAEIHFYEEVEKNGRKSMELTKKYPKNPVHLGLEKLFKDLRIHLLEVCGYVNDSTDKNIKDMYINQTFVDTIEIDPEFIVIHGEKQVFDEKYISLKTCKLQLEDDYEHYESVLALATRITEETKEYMGGNIKVEDEELILRYAQTKHREDEFSPEKLNSYTKEQLAEIATKIIEKGLGGMVMLPEDLKDVDEALLSETMEEIKTDFAIDESEEGTVIDMPAQPEKVKRGKKAEIKVEVAVPLTQSNNEEF